MDYIIRNTLVVTIILLFGYTMYLMEIVNKTKVRSDDREKELNFCTNNLAYYKWVFKNMPKEEYLQGGDRETTGGRWEHNATFNIPINLTGLKNRPP